MAADTAVQTAAGGSDPRLYDIMHDTLYSPVVGHHGRTFDAVLHWGRLFCVLRRFFPPFLRSLVAVACDA